MLPCVSVNKITGTKFTHEKSRTKLLQGVWTASFSLTSLRYGARAASMNGAFAPDWNLFLVSLEGLILIAVTYSCI